MNNTQRIHNGTRINVDKTYNAGRWTTNNSVRIGGGFKNFRRIADAKAFIDG